MKKGEIYKRIDGAGLSADIFLPNVEGIRPAVLVVHGGGWTKRSGNMEWICKELASAGFVAVNVTYRLAPQHRYPCAVEDIRDSIHWIKENAAELNIDSSRIAAWGYSAGANLALLAGLDPDMGLKAIVSGGTPADLTKWPRSPLVKAFIGQSLRANRKLWEDASPVNRVQRDSPPVFLYHGQWDLIVSVAQLRLMKEALQEKSVIHESYVAPYMGHIGSYFFSRESVVRAIKFLQSNMG